MDRRKFIRQTGAAAAAMFAAPYILPSGRLFAASGGGVAQHVVFVLFAGGVRQQESVLQRYLADSQNEPYEGNVMYNLLNGTPPEMKIVYGTGLGGINPIPSILGQTLQSQGTLFREMRAVSTGHFGGLNSLLQGSTAATQGLQQKPLNPTIFEYLRRHAGLPATKTWFLGNSIGNSVPLLNYSIHPNYGARYGANFFAPNVTFGALGQQYLGDAKVYHPDEQLAPVYAMKAFLDNSFEHIVNAPTGIGNTAAEKADIKAFMVEMFNKTQNGAIAHPPVHDGGDLTTVGYACEVMKWFKPALTVVNMSGVDGCHSSFTGYLGALHRADHAVGHLWNYIQTQVPEMAGNTTIIAVPECGRNDDPNAIRDENDWYSFDHSDENAYRVFGIMAGAGVQGNLQVGSEGNPIGLTTDLVPTIAELLGIKSEVMGAGLIDPEAMSLFDRIDMERLLAYGLLSVLFFSACKKEENPFDTIEHTEETTVSQQLPLTNFAGLHQRIFRPTCAVSGCHDGTFEPEFRTIASAYNSLVYHPVIANDPQESFTYRVLPGNAQASFLHERLTVFVANTSGVMPLDVTTDSDWPANDDAYISAITAWINSGAKDMFGQAPTLGNRQPQAIGFGAFPAGNTNAAYPREQGAGIRPIEVPAAQVDLWFAFDDDSTDASAFTYQTYRLATGPLAFGTVPELPLEIGATCVGPDFGGSAATFTHRAVLDLSAQPVGTLLLVRVHVNDGDHADPAELPNDGSSSDMTDLFTLKIVP